MTNAKDVPHDADRLDPAIWRITAVAILGSFLSQLDATIVNVSLSSLAVDLNTSLTTIQWVTSGYLLALTLILPLNGWLVDRIGAKALYLWCFSAFTLTSALCGLAWSAESLIGFRILQGLSGGLLAPMTQMMMARAAGKHMARVIGYAAVPVLLAPVLGPVIAGAILHSASWRWLFLVNLPVGILAIVLAFIFLPNDAGEARSGSLDWVGLALLSPGLVLFLFAADNIGAPIGWVTLTIAIVLLVAFWAVARRKGDRALLNLGLFRGRIFATAAATQFLSNGVSFAGQMLIPIFLIRACGRTPGEMAWLLAPLGLGMLCTYPLMGTLTKHFGIRLVAASGAFLGLLGTLPFVYLASHGFDVAILVVGLFVRGVGLSAVGVPSVSAAYASVSRQELPMANTTLNIVQRLGGPTLTTLCATFLGWMTSRPEPSVHPAAPFVWVFVLLCALHALCFVSTMWLPAALGENEKPAL